MTRLTLARLARGYGCINLPREVRQGGFVLMSRSSVVLSKWPQMHSATELSLAPYEVSGHRFGLKILDV